MMIFRIVCWRKGLYPRGRWDLHTKSIWKGGLKKWPLNGNQITLGYTQLDIFKYMSLWTIEKEGCRKWPLKGKQITGRGIFSVVLTRRGYTGHRTQLWTYSTHSKFSRIDLNSTSLNLRNKVFSPSRGEISSPHYPDYYPAKKVLWDFFTSNEYPSWDNS